MEKMNYKKKFNELLDDLLKMGRYYSDWDGDLYENSGGDLIKVEDLENLIKKYAPELISEPKPVAPPRYTPPPLMTYVQVVPEYYNPNPTDNSPPAKS